MSSRRRIYLDHNASEPLLPEVRAALVEAFKPFGNASSLHLEGRRAKLAVEKARTQVAKLIGAEPEEIIFTASGSEANNMVVNSFAERQIFVSSIEHPSVLESAKKLGSEILPVDSSGLVGQKSLARVQTCDLVSIMSANNEVGVVQDIKKLAETTHRRGAYFHTDAVQAAGKVIINVCELGVDYLTISAHKIGGPQGVGALFVHKGAPLTPLILGGHQENGRRAGTYNTAGIIGFGVAAECAQKTLVAYQKHIAPLRDHLRERILSEIPHTIINGDQKNILPNTLNVSFAGAEGESILLMLDEAGFAVSTGSACASASTEPSPVLMALKADPELTHGSIRFSLGLENTKQDINELMTILPEIIARLRSFSTMEVE